MNKRLLLILLCVAALALTGCGGKGGDKADSAAQTAAQADYNLVDLSSNVVYAQVSDMMTFPENFVGKTVRVRGPLAAFSSALTGREYYTVVITDALACCTQGMEFLCADAGDEGRLPAEGEEVTITGTFETYEEAGFPFVRLKDAVLG